LFERKSAGLDAARRHLAKSSFSARDLHESGVEVNRDSKARTGLEALTLKGCRMPVLVSREARLADIPRDVAEQLEKEAVYANYLERQQRDAEALDRDDAKAIPDDFDFRGLPGLSHELSAKLERVRPESVGQASRIDGMTPAALSLIVATLRRQTRQRSA
jgi:tRNA uridine 5-carboxymethylaminomethyl modification enzyme